MTFSKILLFVHENQINRYKTPNVCPVLQAGMDSDCTGQYFVAQIGSRRVSHP